MRPECAYECKHTPCLCNVEVEREVRELRARITYLEGALRGDSLAALAADLWQEARRDTPAAPLLREYAQRVERLLQAAPRPAYTPEQVAELGPAFGCATSEELDRLAQERAAERVRVPAPPEVAEEALQQLRALREDG